MYCVFVFLQIFVDDTRMHAQTRVQDGTLEMHDSVMVSPVRRVGGNITELISLKSVSSMRRRDARYDAGSNIDSRLSFIPLPAANELQAPTGGSRPLSSRPSADGEEVGQHDDDDVQSNDEHRGRGKYDRGWWSGEFHNSEVQDRYLCQMEFQRVPELVAGLWLQTVIIVTHFSSLLTLERFRSPHADAARAQAAMLGLFLPLLVTSSLAFVLALAKWFVEKQSKRMRGAMEDGGGVDGVVGDRQVHEGGSYKFPVSFQGLQRLLVLIKIAYAGCSMGFGFAGKENSWSLFYLMYAEAAHAFCNGLTARCTIASVCVLVL